MTIKQMVMVEVQTKYKTNKQTDKNLYKKINRSDGRWPTTLLRTFQLPTNLLYLYFSNEWIPLVGFVPPRHEADRVSAGECL